MPQAINMSNHIGDYPTNPYPYWSGYGGCGLCYFTSAGPQCGGACGRYNYPYHGYGPVYYSAPVVPSPKGCVCPPTSEKTCENESCPRKAVFKKS